jgi:hypothetical protein
MQDEEEMRIEAGVLLAAVDYLKGLMPPAGALHLAQYPAAAPQPPLMPLVTRLAHDRDLLEEPEHAMPREHFGGRFIVELR